jgi:PBP1b-binding outer membrane lipoprotein LpoB
MKLFRTIIMVLSAAVVLASCTEETPVVEYLDVTPNNISGE